MQNVIKRLLVCGLVVAVVAGCGARNPPQITVINNSTSAVTDVLLYGNGFKQIINRIEPNDSKTVTVLPKGESSVTMEAATPVKYLTAKDVGYFEREGGYKILITITPDLNIETKVDLNIVL
jgi:hypothetical protein